MLTYILFITGFFLLIKGANILVDGSVSIAKKLKISNIVIGLTIVAFGTSTPEFFINIFASIKGNTEIAIGNVLGSNIANVLLILGVSSVIYPIIAKRNTVMKEIPFSLLAVLMLGIMANDKLIDHTNSSVISRIDGLVFLSFLIIFLYYTFGIAKSSEDILEKEQIKNFGYLKSIIFIILGIISLIIGGNWIVEGAVKIANSFHISQSLVSLTIIAIGTSLPELATSVVAAYKRHSDIAIGNIVGSNIFNIFWILGFSAIIRPLPFESSSNIDVFVAILSTLILFLIMLMGEKNTIFGKSHTIQRWQGILMVIIYFAYIIFLIMNK